MVGKTVGNVFSWKDISPLAERIFNREDIYLKYTLPPHFATSPSQSLGGFRYDLSLKGGILEELGEGEKGSINVNVRDTAHSVFEIVGVKSARQHFI